MINLSLVQITEILQGQFRGKKDQVNQVSTDTRTLCAGDLFVALSGDCFDGHDFARQACEVGAKGLLVDRWLDIKCPQIKVKNTRRALGQLAAFVRLQSAAKIVAITGSCGKTTVKEMVTSICRQVGPTLATAGNFNNEIGVPLSLLGLTPEHQYGVFELGASYAGEIAWTTTLVKPDVALINNVTASHLEGFGSLDGIAKAKFEIFNGLGANGIALANADDDYWPWWQKQYNGLKGFSTQRHEVDFYAQAIEMKGAYPCFQLCTPAGDLDIQLSVAGAHQVANGVAAASIAYELGIDLVNIKKGLEATRPVSGRCFIYQSENLTLIDDSYNASFDSVLRALDLLATYAGYRIFVFGGMAELGQESKSAHLQIGQYAQRLGIDMIVTLGEAAKPTALCAQGHHFEQLEVLIAYVQAQIQQHQPCIILTKGARSAHMENVFKALQVSRESITC